MHLSIRASNQLQLQHMSENLDLSIVALFHAKTEASRSVRCHNHMGSLNASALHREMRKGEHVRYRRIPGQQFVSEPRSATSSAFRLAALRRLQGHPEVHYPHLWRHRPQPRITIVQQNRILYRHIIITERTVMQRHLVFHPRLLPYQSVTNVVQNHRRQ